LEEKIIINQFNKIDPFCEAEEDISNEMHIRVISRGRKKITIIQGIPKNENLKNVLSKINKECHCSGGIVDDPNYGMIIKLTGDQQLGVRDFMIKTHITSENNIQMHGV